MKDRPRSLQPQVDRALREFPVVTVIGLRQAGKTTLVRHAGEGRAWVTLDDLGALEAARRDPQGFIDALPRPVTIDEVQRVPELLLPVKREADRKRRNGSFLLTGSARIDLRRGVQETLAGRAALLRLRPMTWAEASWRADWNPVDELLRCRSAADAAARFARGATLDHDRVLAGGLPPALLHRRGAARGRWLDQYRAAYVERDVPPLVQIEDLGAFLRFLALAASRTAQTTNHAALAHAAGVSVDTGLRWLGVLEATFLADRVTPWWRNVGKRIVKSPKLHFGDAGLAARTLGVRTWEEAARHNLAGALLETLVAQHLFAFTEGAARPTQLHHYRTHAGAEVDFVVARGARLLPIEVKSSATARPADAAGMRSFLDDFGSAAPFGVVLYGGSEAVALGRGITALPLSLFLEGPP